MGAIFCSRRIGKEVAGSDHRKFCWRDDCEHTVQTYLAGVVAFDQVVDQSVHS